MPLIRDQRSTNRDDFIVCCFRWIFLIADSKDVDPWSVTKQWGLVTEKWGAVRSKTPPYICRYRFNEYRFDKDKDI